ncbi:MAG: pectate lyase [Planctomycetes bacterium]|nr:pectate lyase [Planctomycetota bacterium]
MRTFRLLPAARAAGAVPAFPGAEGFGARATGGRGGRVLEVTNLNDRGPGSLREAAGAAGPRIVVFRVSGTIALESTLRIKSDITIAGQTAPGDGICLKDYGADVSGASNVIVRFLRFRPGDERGAELDALGGRGGRDIIIDHCSASWSTDECVSFYDNEDVTVQWCLIAESLYHSVHHKGEHGYGGIWGGTNASFHHNVLAHHSSRNPRVAGQQQGVDLRNNVIYNWGFNSLYGGEESTVNVVGSTYKPGPATRGNVRNRILDGEGKGGRWYLEGNVVSGDPAVTADNWSGGVHRPWAAQDVMRARAPFPAAAVKTQKAQDAYDRVLAGAGAILPKRDPIDARIIEEVRTGTAHHGGAWGEKKGIIDSQDTVGGWPDLASAKPPADGDHDGMPDDWERRHGLDPQDPTDGPADRDGDGYTNVEEYLNALAAPAWKG